MSTTLEHSHDAKAIGIRLAQGPRSNYLRDFIYGAIDGAVTTFAVVAGVEGAHLSGAVVLVLGFANLIADGFAMAASNYSGTKADRDNYERVIDVERRHIALVPDGEREEIRQIFAAKGFAGADLAQIVELFTARPALWARTMAMEEYGLSPTPRSPVFAGLTTFAAFILCGLVPLATYLVVGGLAPCVAATAATFFCVGAMKSQWSLTTWWQSGFNTLVIGMSAAVLAFAVGFGLKTFFHVATA